MDQTTPREQLEDIFQNGISIDIYHIDEAFYLEELISEEAKRINAASFGSFFGSLQILLTRIIILHTTKIFEKPGCRFRLRNIPAALKILQDNISTLKLEQTHAVVSFLKSTNIKSNKLNVANKSELPTLLINHFNAQLEKFNTDGETFNVTYKALKDVRDKFIAHPEAISQKELAVVRFDAIKELLDLAKNFVRVVGFAYLGIAYGDDNGTYFLSNDAKRSAICLRRLLSKAGVLDKPSP